MALRINQAAIFTKLIPRFLQHKDSAIWLRMLRTSTLPSLTITPKDALLDDKIDITVRGLEPLTRVTLTSEVEASCKFGAFAHYISDVDGSVDLKKRYSIGGSYTGVEPMGPLWAMSPLPGQKEGLRFGSRDVTVPFEMKLSVFPGHVDISECDSSTALVSDTFRRSYMGTGVLREMVTCGNIRGVLFLPPGDGPFPGVIDLFGTAGGLIQYRSALLASRGFAMLSLAYFKYSDLPENLTEINLQYFEEAVDFLHSHGSVDSKRGGIGVLGLSKGGDIALMMAKHFPKVRAVVALNANDNHVLCPMRYKDKIKQSMEIDVSKVIVSQSGVLSFQDVFSYPQPGEENCVIEVENSKNAKFLVVASEDDRNTNPITSFRLVERLKKYGKDFEFMYLPGAGHAIEPPYTPLCSIFYHRVVKALSQLGGEPKAHCDGQIKTWNRIQSFLKENLQSKIKSRL